MTTSAPSRVSTSAFFYTVDDFRPSTIHLLRELKFDLENGVHFLDALPKIVDVGNYVFVFEEAMAATHQTPHTGLGRAIDSICKIPQKNLPKMLGSTTAIQYFTETTAQHYTPLILAWQLVKVTAWGWKDMKQSALHTPHLATANNL
ncbi:hypothetical protein U1Q18_017198 [Sarracenia purpurea var. burkii]